MIGILVGHLYIYNFYFLYSLAKFKKKIGNLYIVDQELSTLPDNLTSALVLSGVRVTRYLVV